MNRKAKIIVTPGREKRQMLYLEHHVIPDDTEVRPKLPHTYFGSTCNVLLVHIYNIMARGLKLKILMANYMAKILPPKKIQHHYIHTRYTRQENNGLSQSKLQDN